MTSIVKTIRFIQDAHFTQAYGNQPYWTHPVNVANVGTLHDRNFDEDCYIAALLHDVVEDTDYTLNDLAEMGYNENVVEAVAFLTKNPKFSYLTNIEMLIASGNVTAMRVKYFDNFCNFLGDKSTWDAERAHRLNTRYAKSMDMLNVALKNVDPTWREHVCTMGY